MKVSFWTAVIVIVAIWGLVSVIRSRQDAAIGYGPDEDRDSLSGRQRERELRAEIAQLRDRLEVLERIATDDRESKRLSAEIENLRTRD